jgi:hypothetical protein
VCALWRAAHAGPAAVFWVGAAAPCNFNSLQTAIGAVPDGSIIRIASNQSYDDINVVIDDTSLTLEGGWADCSGSTNGQQVSLVGDPTKVEPVLRIASITNARAVTLRHLHISGGRRSGIEISGHVDVRVERSTVDGNSAQGGGGIRVFGNSLDTSLRVIESTVGNSAAPPQGGNVAISGGGIHCSDATLRLLAAVIRNNHAEENGGGLFVDDCAVYVGVNHYAFGELGDVTMFIGDNSAANGGGVFARGGSALHFGPATLAQYAIRANQADQGGGVYLTGAGTALTGEGLSLSENHASERGGAGMLTDSAQLTMRREGPLVQADDTDGGIIVATRCAQTIECSDVSFNRAEAFTGSAFYVQHSTLALQQTVVSDNFAHNGSVFLLFDHSIARVENSLVRGNDGNGGDLIRVLDGSVFTLNSSTLAGNTTGPWLINLFSDNGANTLTLRNSILWQPSTLVLSATAVDTVTSDCVNAHEHVSIDALDHDPGFMNAAGGDYRLLPSSPNIDACADPFALPTDDILGLVRPTDLAPDQGGGAFDRGAYELPDLIFADGFDLPAAEARGSRG